MKFTFQEAYGTLTAGQWTLYKKYNITPMEHSMLMEEFGEENHADIIEAVKERSEATGRYQPPWG